MTFVQAAADTAETTSSTSDYRIALVGLAGALIGGLATFLGVWWQGAHQAREARRVRLADLADLYVKHLFHIADIEDKYEDDNSEPDPELLAEIKVLKSEALRTVSQMHVHGPRRMMDAGSRMISMEVDELTDAFSAFAIVVRGEISSSWFERWRIRRRSLDEIFESEATQ